MENVYVMNHPLIQHKISMLRDPSLEVNTIFFRRSNYIKHLTNALKQGFFYFPKYLQNYFLRVIIMALVALYQK